MNAPPLQATLIALDWGSTNLRASLLGQGGRPLETRSAAGGIFTAAADADLSARQAQFAQVLYALCGDWLAQSTAPLVASGMIGSRQGWAEAPYLDCPATLAHAAAHLIRVPLGSAYPERTLCIAPGVQYQAREANGAAGQFDVMRGEETQLWGAGLAPGSCCVLPGTHSKWAWVGDGGQITHFRTYMTGELYAVLRQHSILGRLMPARADSDAPTDAQDDAFAQGVLRGLAHHGSLTHALFATRTAGLMARLAPESLADYLSGMLVGAEVEAERSAAPPVGQSPAAVRHLTLIGEPRLCARYQVALSLAGITSQQAGPEVTTQGQWLLAQAAGLV